jgi:methyl-accepting chemotaxis protein
MAEELSATIQELSGAAGEILVAIDQISRGAQLQAAATQQAGAAMTQIEKAAGASSSANGQRQFGRAARCATCLQENRRPIGVLVAGVSAAAAESASVLDLVETLEVEIGVIGKFVDGLA